MTINKTTNTESSQGDGGAPRPSPGPPPQGQYENVCYRAGNTVFKSGPLFISSRGIGWTSWKKRWFILTRTSLVFFRSDPTVVPQRGSEVNLTLGGIDLNNSGSVVVKADKKLLTVLFPDGRDGRAFTLKAETLEDLYEWKSALENALAQAPSSALVMGQNGIFKNDQTDGIDASMEQSKDKVHMKALVIGGPVLLALENADGSPSFLEKALRYIEEYGVKVEGILRQAAAVDDVEHRIWEYEQGKTEFSATEDAHVIADCVKYFLRELPSSPVPASCCNALLVAFRKDRGNRVNAMRVAIMETFPEPNRKLLERILLMMQLVASHKSENRMSTSAVAACMAPLLLRPLLAGECNIENNFDMGGDGSVQLLQAAAAANHAQAIVITLLEEYDKIFGEAVMAPALYSDSDEYESEDEEVTDDDESYEDDEEDDVSQKSDAYTDDDLDDASIGTESGDGYLSEDKAGDNLRSPSKPSEVDKDSKIKELSNSVQTSLPSLHGVASNENSMGQSNINLTVRRIKSDQITLDNEQTDDASACIQNSRSMSNGPAHDIRSPTTWGRTPARKNLSVESIDFSSDDEIEIAKLDATKVDLQSRVSEEVKGNAALQASLEQRKKTLHEHRLALEQEVARLHEELQRERDKRTLMEAALKKSEGGQSVPLIIDEKIVAELEEINRAEADVTNLKLKVDDLSLQLNQQREQNYCFSHDLRKDKHREIEGNEASHAGMSASKINTGILEYQHNSASESTNSANKPPSQNQQPDSARKKSSSRSEGVNSTTSALSKLTTRLNFLKERRSQLESRGPGSATASPNKARGGSEARQASRMAEVPERGRGPESSSSFQNSDGQRSP